MVEYTDAYPILQDIIANWKTSNGVKYELNPHFYSNINPAQKSNPESVFAAQTSGQDGSSADWGADPNGNYGAILNFPYNGGRGACCGFNNPTDGFIQTMRMMRQLPLIPHKPHWQIIIKLVYIRLLPLMQMRKRQYSLREDWNLLWKAIAFLISCVGE